LRRRLDEPYESTLAGGVGRTLFRCRDLARGGGNDNVAAAAREHVRDLVLQRKEDTAKIGIDHIVPLLGTVFMNRLLDGDARVVEQLREPYF
jgi:hypothetical protein